MSQKNIHFILVRPQMGENVGSAARALKNFNLSKLRVVNPRCNWPNNKALATSVGAKNILKSAKVYDSIEKSVADLDIIFASTSRIRKVNKRIISILDLNKKIKEKQKIGVIFGSPETTTGGNALKFYASVRLDIRRIGAIKDNDEIIGNQTRVKIVKNKVAPPFKVVEFDIMYGEGISKLGELVDLGVKAEIIDKSGSWFSYKNNKIGQGRENVKKFLKENIDIAKEIEIRVLENAGIVEKAMMEGEISSKEKETDTIKEK